MFDRSTAHVSGGRTPPQQGAWQNSLVAPLFAQGTTVTVLTSDVRMQQHTDAVPLDLEHIRFCTTLGAASVVQRVRRLTVHLYRSAGVATSPCMHAMPLFYIHLRSAQGLPVDAQLCARVCQVYHLK